MKHRLHGWQDKTSAYRSWRYQWNIGAVHDADQIEWRDGKPVAVLELTTNPDMNEHVQKAARPRLWTQFSVRSLRKVAQALNVPFYIVLFTHDLKDFAVCKLDSEKSEWLDMGKEDYRRWLSSL